MIPPILPPQSMLRDKKKKEPSQDIISRRVDGLIPSGEPTEFGCYLYTFDEKSGIKREKVDIFA